MFNIKDFVKNKTIKIGLISSLIFAISFSGCYLLRNARTTPQTNMPSSKNPASIEEKVDSSDILPNDDLQAKKSLESLIKQVAQAMDTQLIKKITEAPEPIEKGSSVYSDKEHAKFCNPVAYEGSQILQVHKELTEEKNFILSDGRFKYKENTYFSNFPPKVYIRPIDGGQTIYVKGNISYSSNKILHSLNELTKIDLSMINIEVYAPRIFNPKIIVNGKELVLSRADLGKYNINLKDLTKQGVIMKKYSKEGYTNIEYQIGIKLDNYEIMDASKFGDFEQLAALPKDLKKLTEHEENDFLDDIVKRLKEESKTPYELARNIFEFTRNAIEYYDIELHLKVSEAIKEGLGDCDDYAAIMVDILKRAGIPAIDSSVLIEDFNILGGHGFVEFALPLKDGNIKWILSEPTWANEKEDPEKYFQQIDRSYLLEFGVSINPLPYTSSFKLDYSTFYSSGKPIDVDLGLIENGIDIIFELMSHKVKEKNLDFPLLYQYVSQNIVNNYYYLAQSQPSENGDLLVKLNNNDQIRISYESKRGKYLTNEEDKEQINQLKSLYEKLGELFEVEREKERMNNYLSFVTYRDQYTDEIMWAQIRVSPYLVERNLPQLLEILEKERILTKEDKNKIDNLYNITHGKNMHYVLNLARDL